MSARKFLTVIVGGVVLAGALSSCALKDMIYAIPDMNNKLSATNKGLNKMGDTMNQMASGTVAINAIPQLENYNNYSVLDPLPLKLLSWGNLLGNVISVDQFVGLADLWLNQANAIGPVQTVDTNGKLLPPTAAQLYEADTARFGRLSALMTVAGNLQEDTVTQLIQREIVEGGQYENDTFSVLALRAFFIQNLLANSSTYQVFPSIGALKHAVTYATAVDRIAQLPYVKKLQFSLTFLEPNGYPVSGGPNITNIQFTMDPSMAPQIWNQVEMAATNDLSFSKPDGIHDAAQMQKFEADYNAQMKVVRARIQYWQSR